MNRRNFLRLGALFVPVAAAPTVAYSFIWAGPDRLPAATFGCARQLSPRYLNGEFYDVFEFGAVGWVQVDVS